MKILVLGSTGFIGQNMVEYFTVLGHDVRVNGVVSYHEDLREPNPIDFHGIDIIIQAAATTSGSKDIVNTPAIHVTDNAVMNSYIFRAAYEAGVKHVIFFSCTTMFSNGVITEDSPIDIHPKYFGVAHTKLYFEKMAEFYAGLGDTKFTVIRHSNIYGPHDKFDLERSHVFGATMTKVMAADDKIIVWGSGEEKRDLLYVGDLCEFVELAVFNQPENFGLYNCGSGEAVSVNELVERIIAASGKDLRIEYDLSAPTIPISLSLDCTKAKNELKWLPRTSLYEGIEKTLNWWKNNVVLS